MSNKFKIPNIWKRASFFRKYFRYNFRVLFGLRNVVSNENIISLARGVLINPIHTDYQIENIVRSAEYASCFRYAFIVEGKFEDPTFDWYRFEKSIQVLSYNFDLKIKFLRGTEERLKGGSAGVPPGINPDSCFIIELLAFTSNDLRNVNFEELQRIGIVLFDAQKIVVNTILQSLRVVSGDSSFKLIKFDLAKYNFGWFSLYPFKYIQSIIALDNSTGEEFALLRRVPDLNVADLMSYIFKNSTSDLSFSVTSFFVNAIEMRYLGQEMTVPAICHTAVENFIDSCIDNLGIKSDGNEKFSWKVAEVQKQLSLGKDVLHLSNLYLKYVYEIRNRTTHSGEPISRFLSDYCIYISITWIGMLLDSNALKKIVNFKEMHFPFHNLKRSKIDELTKTLREKYGTDLKRMTICLGEIDDAYT